jgi:hypothetical protein
LATSLAPWVVGPTSQTACRLPRSPPRLRLAGISSTNANSGNTVFWFWQQQSRSSGAPDDCLRPDPSACFAGAADLQGASKRVSGSGLSARRDPAAEPGPRSRFLSFARVRQLPPMVAVAAQIVHFLPQLVPVRGRVSEALSQFQHLSLERRDLKGQFVSRVSRRFHRGVPNSWDAAGAASDRRLRSRCPS